MLSDEGIKGLVFFDGKAARNLLMERGWKRMAKDLERMPKAMAWRRRGRGLNRRIGSVVRQLLAHPMPMDTPLRYREWMASMWLVWDREEMAAMAVKAMGLSINPSRAIKIDDRALYSCRMPRPL